MKRNGWYVKCQACGNEFYVRPFQIRKGRGKFCSRHCASKFTIYAALRARDDDKWRISVSNAMKRLFKDETKHPRWRGNDVGYYGVHDWITKHYGQPLRCDVCGLDDSKRKYHWANLSGNYVRDIADWKRMCVSCHRKYDYARNRENNKKL